MDLDPSKEAKMVAKRDDSTAKAKEGEDPLVQDQQMSEQAKNAGEVANASDTSRKRARGPQDCLDYESSEEEFVPFTQSFLEPPKLVVATKSKAKRSCKKSAGKQPRKSSNKKSGTAQGNLSLIL